jgi:hypothetical protein
MERILEVNGALMAKERMPSLPVVQDGDVLVDGEARGGSGWPGLTVNQFGLERGEAALGAGVIPIVSLAAHAAEDATGF